MNNTVKLYGFSVLFLIHTKWFSEMLLKPFLMRGYPYSVSFDTLILPFYYIGETIKHKKSFQYECMEGFFIVFLIFLRNYFILLNCVYFTGRNCT